MPSRAQVLLNSTSICSTPLIRETVTGEVEQSPQMSMWVVSPSPSCPWLAAPQHSTVPSSRRAQEWLLADSAWIAAEERPTTGTPGGPALVVVSVAELTVVVGAPAAHGAAAGPGAVLPGDREARDVRHRPPGSPAVRWSRSPASRRCCRCPSSRSSGCRAGPGPSAGWCSGRPCRCRSRSPPQAPQSSLEVRRSASQPLVRLPSQSARPGAQPVT